MKKIIKLASVCAVALTLLSANAVAAKKEKAAPAKKEKAAKPAKSGKAGKFDQAAYDAAYEAGDYAACVKMLLGKGNEKNLVKDMLDADMLLYLSADYQNAGKGFLETYGKMQQTSAEMNAGQVMGAALGGENAIKYSGAEYERYLDWSMRLATALGNNQSDVANGIMKDYIGTFMDEIQALRAQNEEIEKKSDGSLEGENFKKAEAALQASGIDLGISKMMSGRPAKSKVKYESSPFFNYLGTVAYAANADFDHAADFASLNKVKNASELVSVPAGKGRLEVVALSGTIGKRSDYSEGKDPDAVVFNVPGYGPVTIFTKIAYPIFKEQNHAIDSVKVTLSDGTSAVAYLVEDFDEAVKIDVAQKARPAFSRSIFRNVMKNSAAVVSIMAAGAAVQQASGNPLTAKAAQIAFEKAVDAGAAAIANLERADIRQGSYFPHMASAAGFSVAPGTYTVTVDFMSGSNVVESKTVENVVVESGKVSVAVSACNK